MSSDAARIELGAGRTAMGGCADPNDQLLYLATGTGGLTIVDLAEPAGSRLDPSAGVDERVLANIRLSQESSPHAKRCAFYYDAEGRPMVAVAAPDAGVFLVQVGPPRWAIELIDPRPKQDFRIGKGTAVDPPQMPKITVKASVKPRLAGMRFQFIIGRGTRSMDYQDAPPRYAHPPALVSPLLDEPKWEIDWRQAELGAYGGHIREVSIAVWLDGQLRTSSRFVVDWFVLGEPVDCGLVHAYAASFLSNDPDRTTVVPMVVAISSAETECRHVWVTGGFRGTTSRVGYPSYSTDWDGKHGWGLGQLREPIPTRRQIWDWQANLRGSVDVHARPGLAKARAYLAGHTCDGHACTDRDVRLEAYARYNVPGHNYWWPKTPGVNRTQSQFVCGCNGLRNGRPVGGGSCEPRSACYAEETILREPTP